MQPVLAGRSAEPVRALATDLDLEHRVFALTDAGACASALQDVDLVLHCAGPFSVTAEPMLQACLAARAHYLDITGEIAVLERAHALGVEAERAGIVILSGAGFDVVPTDCVAATLGAALPDAKRLALGFDSRSRLSPGTAKTSVEGLPRGGCVRRDGRLVRVPLAHGVRHIDFGNGEKLAVTIPWGDVATAYRTTGIPDIEVYVPASQRLVRQLRALNLVRPLLGLGVVQGWLKGRIQSKVRGPDEAERQRSPTFIWGEARNAAGVTRTARMRTANGYTVTVESALAVVAKLTSGPCNPGSYTPSRLMGSDFAASLPGSTPIQVDHPEP